MDINLSIFIPTSVIDTCSIWNILSSKRLTAAAKQSNCHFAATAFVYYEALYKPRKSPNKLDIALQDKLKAERGGKLFGECMLDISDLQEVDILEQRMRLGKGELSSIAFAKKANLAFMTDDQKARKLGANSIGKSRVQTTPHFLGWLIVSGFLSDGDIGLIIKEHEDHGGPLRPYFEITYNEAMRIRLLTLSKN